MSHSRTLLALYQSAGTVSFRLINVQFSVYYEPPGFNYYTITQSIPCHLIFMAFIMPLSVPLPDFILEGFHLISWVYTMLLICLGFYLSRGELPALCFQQQDRLSVRSVPVSWGALFVCPRVQRFAHAALVSGTSQLLGARALSEPAAWLVVSPGRTRDSRRSLSGQRGLREAVQ